MLRLENVQYTQNLPANLFSVTKTRKNLLFTIDNDVTHIVDRKTNKVVHKAHHDGKFWKLEFETLDHNFGNIETGGSTGS